MSKVRYGEYDSRWHESTKASVKQKSNQENNIFIYLGEAEN